MDPGPTFSQRGLGNKARNPWCCAAHRSSIHCLNEQIKVSPHLLEIQKEGKSTKVRTRLTLLPKQPQLAAAALCCRLFSRAPWEEPASQLECQCHLHSKCHLKLTPEGACRGNSPGSSNSSSFSHTYIKNRFI